MKRIHVPPEAGSGRDASGSRRRLIRRWPEADAGSCVTYSVNPQVHAFDEASSVTYYETTGWRGVMERQEGSPLPKLFPSTPGPCSPSFTLADVNEWPGAQLLLLRSSRPLGVRGLALRRTGRHRLLLANLELDGQQVRCAGLHPVSRSGSGRWRSARRGRPRVRRRTSDDGSRPRWSEAGGLDLELSPYALFTLDEEE